MQKVLFLCIGNSCRSQMAEGFARKYGSDVMRPVSAGFSPASIVQPLTIKVMAGKNVNIGDQFPKAIDELNISNFDLIVNISGNKLPTHMPVEVRDWKVEDPIGKSEELYVAVRDQIENEIMRLIIELRRKTAKVKPGPTQRTPAQKRRLPTTQRSR